MAKKRKAAKSFEQPQSTKLAKFDVEETFNDSEDDFYAGRDKILLDETADTKRRRRLVEQEQGLQPSDEEILAYEDDDEDISEDDGENVSDEEESSDGGARVKASKRGKGDEDEEEDEEFEEENWGTNRADYYGDDVIETEEQAKEEEAEAKRLYQKQLKNMTEADFGFDENEWVEEKKDSKKSRPVTEKLPEAQIPEGASAQQKLDILKTRYPEFVPLAGEFTKLQQMKHDLDLTAASIEKDLKEGAQLSDGIPITVKRNALSAYLATISMYFAVVATAVKDSDARKITALPPLELHEHAVIQSLARARELWDQVADAAIAESVLPPAQDVETLQTALTNGKPLSKTKSEQKPVKEPVQDITNRKVKEKSKKSKDQNDISTSKKKRKSKSKDEAKPIEISDLMNDVASETEDSELGDEQPLTAEEYAEKARKRKSLRFYTSQIASKANKRGHASREAGGDDDLPYKERTRDKHERLLKEAEARGRGKPDEADDFGDEDYNDRTARKDQNDEYYDTLLNANSQKKADKAARADAYQKAAAEGATVYEEETVGADGKRAITYAIAKNKGLAPKRKKEVRNPRVKKRKKYDEKMKKLGSIRQIYKANTGHYGGELTGIKTNVVKSIKL